MGYMNLRRIEATINAGQQGGRAITDADSEWNDLAVPIQRISSSQIMRNVRECFCARDVRKLMVAKVGSIKIKPKK